MAESGPRTTESSVLLDNHACDHGEVLADEQGSRNRHEISIEIPADAQRNGTSRNWPTVDGPIGLNEEESLKYARNFFRAGFFLLPWLWAVNCYYFLPTLVKSPSHFPQIRRYVVGSAVGFAVFTTLLASWALTFAIGGENLFGTVWNRLVMYNVAQSLGLTGWN